MDITVQSDRDTPNTAKCYSENMKNVMLTSNQAYTPLPAIRNSTISTPYITTGCSEITHQV